MNPEKISLQDTVDSLSEEKKEQPILQHPVFSPEHSENSLKSLRTYQGDIESLVNDKSKKTSIASIAAAEQKRNIEHPEMKEAPDVDQPSQFAELLNKTFVTVGIILCLCGTAIIGGVYFFTNLNKTTPITQQENTLIGFNKKMDIVIGSSTTQNVTSIILSNIRSNAMPVNSVLFLNTTDTDSQTIMQLLAPSIPSVLSRSLDTQYMIGAYSSGINEPFILLTTTDYASSFIGMISWEKTMTSDLGTLFSITPPVDTTTPYTFADESVSNKDLRVVKNRNNKTILLYSFLDKNTILIASSEDAFNAILGKFVTNKLVR